MEAGELEEALALFEDALKIDPSRLAKLVAAQQVVNTGNMIQ
jgi:hypothetical protein